MTNEQTKLIMRLVGELGREDLLMVHGWIVQKIKALDGVRAKKLSRTFHKGQMVSFKDRNGLPYTGTILSVNEKTATIRTEAGAKWRVGFAFLKGE